MALLALLQPFQQAAHAIDSSLLAKPYLQGGWHAPRRLCRIAKGGTQHSHAYARRMWVASTSSETGTQSLWSFLFPQGIRYSSDPTDVDLSQLSELWARTLNVVREPREIAKALKHSYAIVAVLDQGEGLESSQCKLVGFGRAVSDGAFIATICDVAVDPAYQRKGIGRRIVKELVKNMKRSGGPTGFAVFPAPRTRMFFWRIGFRSDRNYKFMVYRGRLLDSVAQDEDKSDPE